MSFLKKLFSRSKETKVKEEKKTEKLEEMDKLTKICYDVLKEEIENKNLVVEVPLIEVAKAFSYDIACLLPGKFEKERKVRVGYGEPKKASLKDIERLERELENDPIGLRELYMTAIGLLFLEGLEVKEEKLDGLSRKISIYGEKFLEHAKDRYDFGTMVVAFPDLALKIVRRYGEPKKQ